MERFQLSKERIGTAFAQGSDYASLAAFITACRVEYAARLLRQQPSLPITQVATASGFSSTNHLVAPLSPFMASRPQSIGQPRLLSKPLRIPWLLIIFWSLLCFLVSYLFREFGHVEHWLWKLEALTLHAQSSAFVIKKQCFRHRKAMFLLSKSYALGVLKQCFRRLKDMLSASWRMRCCFQLFTNIRKLPSRPQKHGHRSQVWPCVLSALKRSQVTGVTMLPFDHKGEMKAKNAEYKQRR